MNNMNGRLWAVLRRYDIRDRATGDLFLTRWRLIQTPWFGIFLHRHVGPDPGRELHNHPWSFTSLVLKGGYIERHAPNAALAHPSMYAKMREWRAFSLHHLGDQEFHTIVKVLHVPTWSLLFVGRRQHEWGFMTVRGWVDRFTYASA